MGGGDGFDMLGFESSGEEEVVKWGAVGSDKVHCGFTCKWVEGVMYW